MLVLVEYPGTLEEEMVYEPSCWQRWIIPDNLREIREQFGYFEKQVCPAEGNFRRPSANCFQKFAQKQE